MNELYMIIVDTPSGVRPVSKCQSLMGMRPEVEYSTEKWLWLDKDKAKANAMQIMQFQERLATVIEEPEMSSNMDIRNHWVKARFELALLSRILEVCNNFYLINGHVYGVKSEGLLIPLYSIQHYFGFEGDTVMTELRVRHKKHGWLSIHIPVNQMCLTEAFTVTLENFMGHMSEQLPEVLEHVR